MGKSKYTAEIEALIKKSPVVRYRSIERIMHHKKKTKQYVKQLIKNLIRKEKIIPLTKGWYTSYDEIAVVIFCFQPAYFGLRDALSYHNLWEQETIPIIVTTRKVRQGIMKVMGKNILIRRISPTYFFGIGYSRQNNFAFPYSDIEKTFIDMIYFNEKLSPEVQKEFKKRIDAKKLKSYLKAYPYRMQKRAYAALKK